MVTASEVEKGLHPENLAPHNTRMYTVKHAQVMCQRQFGPADGKQETRLNSTYVHGFFV